MKNLLKFRMVNIFGILSAAAAEYYIGKIILENPFAYYFVYQLLMLKILILLAVLLISLTSEFLTPTAKATNGAAHRDRRFISALILWVVCLVLDALVLFELPFKSFLGDVPKNQAVIWTAFSAVCIGIGLWGISILFKLAKEKDIQLFKSTIPMK